MAKIGSPPPSVPRSSSRTAAEERPRDAARAPASPVQAQQVAQQFGAAFSSAGKLASQFVKGLVTGQPPPPREPPERAPSPRSSRAPRSSFEGPVRGPGLQEPEDARGSRNRGGKRSPGDADSGPPSLLGKAFDALKRARLQSASKSRYAKAGRTGEARELDSYNRVDEDDEDAVDTGPLRAYLRGDDDTQDNPFDQARREAMLLKQVHQRTQSSARLLSQLNVQLASSRDAAFKQHLVHELKPRLDKLAARMGERAPERRRQLAALAARAAHQDAGAYAEAFAVFLDASATAEAQHLLDATGDVAERAADLAQALRRSPSPAYRAAVVDKARGAIEQLARDVLQLLPEELPEVCQSLMRAGESLSGQGATTLAEAFVAGARDSGPGEAMGPLAQELGVVLRTRPGGGFWLVQLLLVFSAGGEGDAARHLAGALQAGIQEARRRGVAGYQALLDLQRQGAPALQQQRVWSRLDIATLLAAGLLPTCGALYALRARMPEGAESLATEALLLLGTLPRLAVTAPGQRALRQALLEQERGEWTFLNAVPQCLPGLATPTIVQALAESGLPVPRPEERDARFLQWVAEPLCRALGGPLMARSRKQQDASAQRLLSTALHINADLFGLSARGAGMAFEALEDLRARSTGMPMNECIEQLRQAGRMYPSAMRGGRVESLGELLVAMTRRTAHDPRWEVTPEDLSNGPGHSRR